MGTPAFAVPCLDILIKNGFDVVAVITATDSLGGRGGKQLLQSDVKKYAVEAGIDVLQPTNLKSPEFLEQLRSYKADLQVVVAFRMLPEVVWDMPAMGTINLHGSLLPKYRGAAPIHHAVINGETETGVTTFRLKHAIDTGDIIRQATLSIGPDENTGSVHDRMMALGATTMLETVQLLENGDVQYVVQNDDVASHAPKLFHHNCKIDFTQSRDEVYNFIRGLSPFPGAWCSIGAIEFKIYQAVKSDLQDQTAGKVHVDKNRLFIACGDGRCIEILTFKPQGNRMMEVSQYLNGHKIEDRMVD